VESARRCRADRAGPEDGQTDRETDRLTYGLRVAGVLTGLAPEEAVALLSALVFQEKSEVEPRLTQALRDVRADVTALALQAGQVQADAGLPVTPGDFVRDTLNFGLMEVGSGSRVWA
jgi:superfamily II RNA helicase